MAKKLRYALIGCGGCGVGKHLASYARYTDDIVLYAACDIVPGKAQAAAERFGMPRVFTDYADLLADPKIDIVSIATPNCFHAPIAIAALEAGKHVHVEKPIAMNAAEAAAIVAARDRSGKLCMVALNNRFTESSRFAKRYVDEGHLGEIYHARCGWRRRAGYAMRGSWFADKAQSGGGPVIDLGVHYLDLTLFFLGYPAPVTVVGSAYDKLVHLSNGKKPVETCILGGNTKKGHYDVEDLAAGFVKLASGASVAFEFSWASHIERETTYLELLGTRGGLSMHDGVLKIFAESGGQPVDILPGVQNTSGWGENETRHFIDCIRTGKAPLAPPEDGVKMMQIIDAIYISSAGGREVVIGDPVSV
jgi:predicted dehydrogenase